MSATEKDINAKLDQLEGDQNITDDINPPADPSTLKPIEDDSPPGFISYEDWTKSGKNPDDWRGKNAYNKEYDRITENRELKSAMKEVVGTVSGLQQQYQNDANVKIAQARADAQAELAQAKEDDNIDAALAAKDKLINLVNPPVLPAKKNPFITEFAQKNPILDPGSSQYDNDFFQDMADMHNNKLAQLSGDGKNLTQAQIERVHKWAFTQTKELHPDKFKSPRNNRQAPANPNQGQSKSSDGNTSSKLKNVKGNPRNKRDASPAQDIYDDLIKRGEKEAAATYAKNVLGEES